MAGPVFEVGWVVGGGAAGRDGISGGLADAGEEAAGGIVWLASAVFPGADAESGRLERVIDK
jgi:hypothetical protein